MDAFELTEEGKKLFYHFPKMTYPFQETLKEEAFLYPVTMFTLTIILWRSLQLQHRSLPYSLHGVLSIYF